MSNKRGSETALTKHVGDGCDQRTRLFHLASLGGCSGDYFRTVFRKFGSVENEQVLSYDVEYELMLPNIASPEASERQCGPLASLLWTCTFHIFTV